MQNKTQPITIAKIIVILMLLWALADNPYYYYQILRWVTAGVAGYSAYLAYKQSEKTWLWILAITAITFNPITPFYLTREIWSVLNIIGALIIFVSIFKMKNIVKINLPNK
ncbi:MAG: DUF6804 family protein [Candidatus Magasanikiibacteriota bacterium]